MERINFDILSIFGAILFTNSRQYFFKLQLNKNKKFEKIKNLKITMSIVFENVLKILKH